MTGNAKPRFLWNGWAPFVAVLLLIVITSFGFVFAKVQADRTLDKAEDRIATASRRNDVANCRTAMLNAERGARAQQALADYLEPLVAASPPGEDHDQGVDLINVLRRSQAALEEPLPCQTQLHIDLD